MLELCKKGWRVLPSLFDEKVRTIAVQLTKTKTKKLTKTNDNEGFFANENENENEIFKI